MEREQLYRAVAIAAMLFACEAGLARLADDPVVWWDLLWSAVGLTLLTAVPVALASRAPERWRERASASGGYLALGLVGAAVALPPQLVDSAVAVGIGVLGGLGLGELMQRREPHPVVGATSVFVGLAVAWAVSWGLSGTLPDLVLLRNTLLLWMLCAGLTLRPEGIAVLLALGIAVARGWVLGPPLPWSGSGQAPDAPDIVLITVDTLRQDVGSQMASYRRVARAGAAVPDVTAAAPWTLPSMATILTGQPLHVHHAGRTATGTNAIDDHVDTLAERLHTHGYDTLAIVDRNMWLDRSSGIDQGFDWFWHTAHRRKSGATASTGRPLFGRIATELGLPGPSELAAERMVDRVLVATELRRDRPLFTWVHFMDVHLPYTHSNDPRLVRANREAIATEAEWASEDGRAQLRAAYENEAALVDAAVMRLLDRVEASERETTVVFTSDHGEELWEHGGFEHGHALWQEVVGVPLAISGIDVPSPRAPAHHLDIASTLLSAAGVAESGLPGRDLAVATSESEAATRTLQTGNFAHGGAPDRGWATRRGTLKGVFGPTRPGLFELSTDPDEGENLSGDQTEAYEALRALPWNDLGVGGEPIDLDRDHQDELEALGYLEPGAP